MKRHSLKRIMAVSLVYLITLLFTACSHKASISDNQVIGTSDNQETAHVIKTIPDSKSNQSSSDFSGVPFFQDIYFDYDQHILASESRAILLNLADYLKKNQNVRLLIEGHCDERGTDEYNLALGQRRANSVAHYLQNLGISSKRISTVSYGEERPLIPESTEEAWSKNRRAHFVLTQTN
ncbi:MAG: peptidoglycan-associated lipoprotein Pal [Smithella sp.]|nr:peptidoglycan-associated lipoprotein Pal [Smithella sp.]